MTFFPSALMQPKPWLSSFSIPVSIKVSFPLLSCSHNHDFSPFPSPISIMPFLPSPSWLSFPLLPCSDNHDFPPFSSPVLIMAFLPPSLLQPQSWLSFLLFSCFNHGFPSPFSPAATIIVFLLSLLLFQSWLPSSPPLLQSQQPILTPCSPIQPMQPPPLYSAPLPRQVMFLVTISLCQKVEKSPFTFPTCATPFNPFCTTRDTLFSSLRISRTTTPPPPSIHPPISKDLHKNQRVCSSLPSCLTTPLLPPPTF